MRQWTMTHRALMVVLVSWGMMLLGAASTMAQDDGGASVPPPAMISQAEFVEQVDLSSLGTLAVHYEGRIKSLDSFSSQIMQLVTGPREVNGQSPTFTYLDMMFRPNAYDDVPHIFVKKKPVRADIANAVRADPSCGGHCGA